MKFIESPWTDPYYNLALEEYVFEKLDRSEDWLILWQNYNTIVIGKYQNTIEEINADYVKEHGISVARRLSGGGAVYHDKGNLNYTIIVDKNDDFDFNFQYFVLPVTNALKLFGVDAAFSGRNDVTIDGKKFSGNSQYVKQNRIMHHGCIMLDSNLANVAEALRVKPVKLESKSTKSVRSRVTTINANLAEPIPMEVFKTAIKMQVAAGNEMEAYGLTEHDIAEIQKQVDLPVIGIVKRDYEDSKVYITPTMKEIEELMEVKPEIIALDATVDLKPGGKTLDGFYREIRAA